MNISCYFFHENYTTRLKIDDLPLIDNNRFKLILQSFCNNEVDISFLNRLLIDSKSNFRVLEISDSPKNGKIQGYYDSYGTSFIMDKNYEIIEIG